MLLLYQQRSDGAALHKGDRTGSLPESLPCRQLGIWGVQYPGLVYLAFLQLRPLEGIASVPSSYVP